MRGLTAMQQRTAIQSIALRQARLASLHRHQLQLSRAMRVFALHAALASYARQQLHASSFFWVCCAFRALRAWQQWARGQALLTLGLYMGSQRRLGIAMLTWLMRAQHTRMQVQTQQARMQAQSSSDRCIMLEMPTVARADMDAKEDVDGTAWRPVCNLHTNIVCADTHADMQVEFARMDYEHVYEEMEIDHSNRIVHMQMSWVSAHMDVYLQAEAREVDSLGLIVDGGEIVD